MAVDTKKLFDEELPGALTRNAEDAKTIGSKFQLNVTGSGAWFVDVSDSGPSITAGEPGGADCTLTVSEEDFQKLYENPQTNGMSLYMGGKLKVQGNPMLAMKLQKLFSYKLPPRSLRSTAVFRTSKGAPTSVGAPFVRLSRCAVIISVRSTFVAPAQAHAEGDLSDERPRHFKAVSMTLIRGRVRETPGLYDRLLGQLAVADQRFFASFGATDWVDVEAAARVMDVAARLLYPDDPAPREHLCNRLQA